MNSLSPTELSIAECYCRGMIDKEVAEETGKPIWTVRTHKKRIYTKLGIRSTHELVLWMVCRYVRTRWDLRQVRERGLSAILTLALLIQLPLPCEVRTRAVRRRCRVETVEPRRAYGRRQERAVPWRISSDARNAR